MSILAANPVSLFGRRVVGVVAAADVIASTTIAATATTVARLGEVTVAITIVAAATLFVVVVASTITTAAGIDILLLGEASTSTRVGRGLRSIASKIHMGLEA